MGGKQLVLVVIFLLLPPVLLAAGGDGRIDFSGALVTTTCTIKLNGVTGNTATIALPHAAHVTMGGAGHDVGTTSGGTALNMQLSECRQVTTQSVLAYFQSGQYVGADGTLVNELSGTESAQGLGLQIYDKNMSPVKAGSTTQMLGATSPVGGAITTLSYVVEYILVSKPLRVGRFATSVTYSLSYQ